MSVHRRFGATKEYQIVPLQINEIFGVRLTWNGVVSVEMTYYSLLIIAKVSSRICSDFNYVAVSWLSYFNNNIWFNIFTQNALLRSPLHDMNISWGAW